jgi:hypothetical protein
MTTLAASFVPTDAEGASPSDLRRRVALALDLAQRTVTTLVENEAPIDLNALEAPTDKVIAETALLCLAVSRLPHEPELSARAHHIASRLAPHARDLRVRSAMIYRPFRALDLGMAHRCLNAMGIADDPFECLLRQALSSDLASSLERLPHRDLEQRWLERLGSSEAMPRRHWARTALEFPMPALNGNRDDWYAFTHAVFYASDFGARQLEPRRDRSAVLGDVDSTLASTLDDDDLDLVGELLLSASAFRSPFSPVARFAFRVLCDIEDRVGIVPSLALSGEAYRQQSPHASEAYALASSYHPAYVMGLVCAQLLAHPELLQRTQPAPRVTRAVLDFAFEILERAPRRPYWTQVFAQLEETDRLESAPIVVDAALRRAVRAFDLGAAHRLASLAASHDLVTSTLRQTAELLTRVAQLEITTAAV